MHHCVPSKVMEMQSCWSENWWTMLEGWVTTGVVHANKGVTLYSFNISVLCGDTLNFLNIFWHLLSSWYLLFITPNTEVYKLPRINAVLRCQESVQRWGRDNQVVEEEVVRGRLQKSTFVTGLFLPFECMAIEQQYH